MRSECSPYEAQRARALSAAGIAAEVLAREAPHAALAAAQEAARCALLALGAGPHRPPSDDLRQITVLAAASPGDLDGRPGERDEAVRATLTAVGRLLPSLPETSADGGVSAPPRTEGGARPRVLVAEDEFFIAADIAQELRDAGLDVLGPASSVAEALVLIEAAASDGGISAAVLDIALLDGRVTPVADALAAIGVPFLFATGYGTECDRCGHAGARLLLKPFGRSALVGAVAGLIATEWAFAAGPDLTREIRLNQPARVAPPRPGAGS
ncbi:hypothetical protein ACFQX4_27905 [Roseomonas sp. GCM10028921]